MIFAARGSGHQKRRVQPSESTASATTSVSGKDSYYYLIEFGEELQYSNILSVTRTPANSDLFGTYRKDAKQAAPQLQGRSRPAEILERLQHENPGYTATGNCGPYNDACINGATEWLARSYSVSTPPQLRLEM